MPTEQYERGLFGGPWARTDVQIDHYVVEGIIAIMAIRLGDLDIGELAVLFRQSFFMDPAGRGSFLRVVTSVVRVHIAAMIRGRL
jgi:hypothetical protein